mgnify:CR=1 FL=1
MSINRKVFKILSLFFGVCFNFEIVSAAQYNARYGQPNENFNIQNKVGSAYSNQYNNKPVNQNNNSYDANQNLNNQDQNKLVQQNNNNAQFVGGKNGYGAYKQQYGVYTNDKKIMNNGQQVNQNNQYGNTGQNPSMPRTNNGYNARGNNPFLPQMQSQQKSPLQSKTRSSISNAIHKKLATGFELDGFISLSGSAGTYKFSVPYGWSITKITPEPTGSSALNLNNNIAFGYVSNGNEEFSSKTTFGSGGLFLRLKFPSLIGINDDNILRPFVYSQFDYSTAKPLQIEANKEISSSSASFSKSYSSYKFDSLKYSNILGFGANIIHGLYGSYGFDIFSGKKRIEAGYDFGNVIVFVANEKLTSNKVSQTDLYANIKYNATVAGLRFKVL